MNATSFEMGAAKPRNRTLMQLLGAPLALGLAIVMTSCAGDRYHRSAGESVDDVATTRRVKSALADDTTYRYSDVKVATFKGTVQLSGFVDNSAQKSKASDIAKHVAGVKEVENNIIVK